MCFKTEHLTGKTGQRLEWEKYISCFFKMVKTVHNNK